MFGELALGPSLACSSERASSVLRDGPIRRRRAL